MQSLDSAHQYSDLCQHGDYRWTHPGSDGVNDGAQITYLLSSPSTSSTAYGVAFRHGNNATEAVYLNRSHNDVDATWQARGASSITIMEIQG